MRRHHHRYAMQEGSGSHSKLRRTSTFRRCFGKLGHGFLRFSRKDSSLFTLLLVFVIFSQWREEAYQLIAKISNVNTRVRPSLYNDFTVSQESLRRGPPSYLPLAQHLKNIKAKKGKPSLEDMVYGVQKRTLPDLKATNNTDLVVCHACRKVAKLLTRSKISSQKHLKLARLIARMLSFYHISSILTIPCRQEAVWILPLVNALREINPGFIHYCVLPNDSEVIGMIKTVGIDALNGTQFAPYKPKQNGSLPKVDLMFTWKGLENFGLDEIHEVFKEAVMAEITYTLIGNTPGKANAHMAETSPGIYSVVRPKNRHLNVRGFPFGFNEAERVVQLTGKQLIMYNTSLMRDTW